MRVLVLGFATAREALGAGERTLELSDDATVADLRHRLAADHPALEALWPRLAVAVDGTIVGDEHLLAEGCEVALLPPVSGGAVRWSSIQEGPIDVTALVEAVTRDAAGAVVLFVGNVRDHHGGHRVSGISYSAYRPMAETVLAEITHQLMATDPELRVAIVHRLGELAAGETSVVIATSSPHRKAAYAANRTALEELKRRVPIWKQERYVDGTSRWREEECLRPGSPSG